MIGQFELILESLKHPKVKLINRAFKKQPQLFEAENEIDVQFNGYASINDYQEFIDTCFQKCKNILQSKMITDINEPLLFKQNLDLLMFEVKSFRKRYFQQQNDEFMFLRVEVLKQSLPVKQYDELSKKNTSIFFSRI